MMQCQQKVSGVTHSIHVTGLPRSLMLHATEGLYVPCMVVCTEVDPGTTAMEQVPLHLVAI